MGRVTADRGDARVQARQPTLRLGAVGRPLPLARQATARAPQAPEQRLVGPRTRDRLARAERRQGGDPQVDADAGLGMRQGCGVGDLDQHGGEPPVRLAAHRDAPGLAREAQRLAHPDGADARQLDAATIADGLPGLVGGAEAVADAAPLEARVAPASIEEGPERGAEVDDRLLHGAFGDLEHPGIKGALERVEVTPERYLRGRRQGLVLLPGLVAASPLGQGPVVGEAGGAGRAGEGGALPVGGIELHPVGDQHAPAASAARLTSSCNFWFLRLRLP